MAIASPLLKTLVILMVAALTIIAGCASAPPTQPAAPGPAPHSAMDISYDWHRQVIVPFGTLLKSSPVPLHEVLLFRDEAPGVAAPAADVPAAAAHGADAENKDCYTIDGTPPRLVGQTPDAYLLCFDHDRLNRIESSVHLPAEGAARIFAQACTSWQNVAVPSEATSSACEGRTGTTAFKAHLAVAPGEPATLSLILLNASLVP